MDVGHGEQRFDSHTAQKLERLRYVVIFGWLDRCFVYLHITHADRQHVHSRHEDLRVKAGGFHVHDLDYVVTAHSLEGDHIFHVEQIHQDVVSRNANMRPAFGGAGEFEVAIANTLKSIALIHCHE